MSDWDWVTTEGNVGELPVRILPRNKAEFVLDYSDVRIDSFSNHTDTDLRPGDICILRSTIVEAERDDPPTIKITIHNVEIIKQTEENVAEINRMMQHLDAARKHHQERQQTDFCDNCREITHDTELSADARIDDRDLHYCAKCGRLLSTNEYQQYKELDR